MFGFISLEISQNTTHAFNIRTLLMKTHLQYDLRLSLRMLVKLSEAAVASHTRCLSVGRLGRGSEEDGAVLRLVPAGVCGVDGHTAAARQQR